MRLLQWIFLAQLSLGTVAVAQQDTTPTLPPITEPASEQYLPGKFVWADLFTSDVEASRKFYKQVFGWEWREIEGPPQPYGLFYLHDEPVAGLAYREAPDGGDSYGRWIHFISVENVSATERAISKLEGHVVWGRRSYDDRGDIAIFTDAQETLFGVIRSSSGDPGDYRVAHGDWIWRQLFSHDLGAAIRFYTKLFAYEVEKDYENPEIVEYTLMSNGYDRAGIGLLEPESDTAPVWLGYVRVDDIEAAIKRAVAHGGKVLFELGLENTRGGLAIIADPTGANVGLLQWEYTDADQEEVKP